MQQFVSIRRSLLNEEDSSFVSSSVESSHVLDSSEVVDEGAEEDGGAVAASGSFLGTSGKGREVGSVVSAGSWLDGTVVLPYVLWTKVRCGKLYLSAVVLVFFRLF